MTEQDSVNSNTKRQRIRLFSSLDHVLAVSTKKFDMEKASNSDRQAWARIVVQAIQSYGKLLETAQLEEIEERLEALESKDNGRKAHI